jgi:acyl-CoA hydrolase
MTLDEKIAASETRLFKAVFPGASNHYDTLFGGTALALMDEAAFIAATRLARKPVVTVSSGKIDFNRPIPTGTLIELVAEVVRVGNTSLDVRVRVFVERMDAEGRELAIEGTFAFVALDENKRPARVVD